MKLLAVNQIDFLAMVILYINGCYIVKFNENQYITYNSFIILIDLDFHNGNYPSLECYSSYHCYQWFPFTFFITATVKAIRNITFANSHEFV